MQMTDSKTEDSLYEVRDGIAFLTFNRPQSYNALTFEMYDRLADVCAIANADRSIRAMVLTGAGGKAFAAGTDIAQFRSFRGPDDALSYEARIERVLAALEECRVPTLAAIAGACTGGGLGIAACCDIRISADNARFGMPIARTLGNCLSLSNYARFADLLGTARLKEMIFTARLITAQEANAIGLVSEIVDGPERLLARAEELARTIASHAPLTLQASKRALRRLRPDVPPNEGSDIVLMCYMSRDFREGMEAFLTKRAPQFTGE